ncbi:thiamine monophosphate synthase [Flavobacterium enshiense DK69]|uniref:Thiamine monophosphate synthase n=1 Tax=Flavobacterium enshiense DK69 TaxID=1107311 RepID=V6S8Z5_9FLAO|nr:thiamine phosphate synthase [Flavobacterium enshiense]ESU23138.1 thiamine monophosphate synthase [Flavobacterium enshiense DK69]KGO96000.1 thiamine monophosphate synthase [Flavobacterium enshiense DK69]
MIVITNPTNIENEISIIHSLFAEGLPLLHVRKPGFSEAELKSFLSEIGLEFRSHLVLHSSHHLADTLGIKRLHFSESNRSKAKLFSESKWIKSASVHTIQEFNTLGDNWNYAFLSPIFPSISKSDYVSDCNHLEAIKQRTNFNTKLVALGGISSENIQKTLGNGFDDVALLGSIWLNTNPIENFKKCQQLALTF